MSILKNIGALIVFWQLMIFAQNFEVDVTDFKIGLDDNFDLSFTFSAPNLNESNIWSLPDLGLINFSPPDLSAFYILSGPNQSKTLQFINGVVFNCKSYSYSLRAKSEGQKIISSASVELDEKIYRTEPITVEFVKGTLQPLQDNQQPTDEEISKDLYIKAILDKHIAYIGEKITITYKLYTRLSIAPGMIIRKLPPYNGFKAEELNANSDFTTEVIAGRKYSVGILKQVALFPIQFGELTITPIEINLQVEFQKKKSGNNIREDIFDDPFSRIESVDYLAKSNALSITVLPLAGKK